ncbi:PriCT-2 domain-containing protein [Magnetococcus sp. PR-3]|uniref:PriCT-2 domain-containing protein n=1 Tax=Magnetococcus sp. PR-3 TaxID=3120355 RepID=UPI002FCDFFE9
MNENFMMQHGDRLVAAGFPILPIAPGHKYPGSYLQSKWTPYKGWNKHASRATTEHELAIWKQWPDAGIGIPGGMVAGIDIDVEDETVSLQLEQLAIQLLGTTPAVRIGRAPKRLLVYRTDTPFKGIKKHPLEVLCLGQQFVAYAIHPDTGKPYQWTNQELIDLSLADLPVIAEQQAHDFIDQGLALLPERIRPTRLPEQNTPVSYQPTYPMATSGDQRGTFEAVADAMRYIVNADLPYDDWVRIGMAIKGALGEEGASLFAEWSSCSSKNVSEETASAWAGFKPTLIGAGTIYHLAGQNGWRPDPSITLNPDNLPQSGPHPAAQFMQKMHTLPPPTSEVDGPPFLDGPEWDPTDLDGALGMLVHHMLETATRPQPILAVGNALCALGSLMGRRYRTETDLRSNLYIVGIADSGSGKNHSREVIIDLFMRAGLKKHLGGNRIASGAGLLRAVHDQPAILFQQDEFGMFLDAAADRKRSPRHITDILDLMTELYSSASTTFLGPEYATPDKKGRKDINQPCLCVYGTTTPVLFWGALKSANVADGSLARFLILKTQDDYPEGGGGNVIRPLPDALIEAAMAIAEGGSMGGGNMQGVTSGPETAIDPMVVPMCDEARALFDDLNKQVITLLRKARSTPWSPILARVWENASKVALIRAVSFTPSKPIIREVDAVWAIALVRYAVNSVISDVEQHVADNRTEQHHKRVLGVIRKAGHSGITQRDLTRKTQFLDKRERQDILQTLLEAEVVVAWNQTTKTRPAMTYKAVR